MYLQTANNKTDQTYETDIDKHSIYVDAEEKLLKEWYIKRFLKFHEKCIQRS